MMRAISETSALVALVVDDDEVFRNRLCRAFASRGWQAHGAADSPSAIQLADAHGPDLAVIDLRLSGTGGLDIVRDLRRLDETVCIIMLTGYGSISTALTAVKLGADHYMSKPADADQILACYQKLTGQSAPLETSATEVPSLARVEWEHIQRILADCQGNISQAAKLLGLHRRSLQRKLSKYAPTK
jgi:two-component system response regulator RegA